MNHDTLPQVESSRGSIVARLAVFFAARPGQWVDGRELARIAGAYAWRTRVSDLRRAPFHMVIQNRQRRVATLEGRRFVVSQYRLVEAATQRCAS